MQVKDCLKQNEELRAMLDKLRTEQASVSTLSENSIQRHLLDSNKDLGDETLQANPAEVISLKVGFIRIVYLRSLNRIHMHQLPQLDLVEDTSLVYALC